MAEVNKEKSAARLASLQKCAAADRSAARLETLKKCAADAAQPAQSDADGLAYRKRVKKIVALLAGGLMGASAGTAISGGKGSGTVLGAGTGMLAAGLLNNLHNRYVESAGMDPTVLGIKTYAGTDPRKMAEDRSAKRLATLKKCAAADRSAARHEALTKAAADNSTTNAISEVAGHLTSPAILGILGTLALRHPIGGAIGATAGGLGAIGGGIAALLKAHRSAPAQADYDNSTHILKNLLIPGQGSYNMWKRVGRFVENSSK